MSFLEFQQTFSFLPIISVAEIRQWFPNYDVNALTRWQQKGYLEKVRNGYYRLTHQPIQGEQDLYFIANRIYQPSYISLYSALRWYDWIPEGVFITTSVSTRKTKQFKTKHSLFTYQRIQPRLFFGYRLLSIGAFRFKIATPEKALLDFLYFHPNLKEEPDFSELRLNIFEIKEQIDPYLLAAYLSLFASKVLEKRVAALSNYLEL